MNTNRPVHDPEAVALAKVYALLIEAARKRNLARTTAGGEEINEKAPKGNEAETLPLREAATVPPSTMNK